MQSRDITFIVIVVLACLVGFYMVSEDESPSVDSTPAPSIDEHLPDFTVYSDVGEKKQAFFEFLLPMVQEENQRLLTLRQQLKSMSQNTKYDQSEAEWLLELAREYRVMAGHATIKEDQLQWVIEELLVRVDQVPASLALAQAANESAWGTSRFALEGNNLYGQWCFRPGCGLVPNSRPDGQSYEVATFESPFDSVRGYIHNLNTNLAYKEFRQIRAEQRAENLPLSGQKFAEGLVKYSSRGQDYIEELQAMIRVNQLEQYDTI